jgi:dipeptidyl aminopeptidase/acylaminoacyl peptidase
MTVTAPPRSPLGPEQAVIEEARRHRRARRRRIGLASLLALMAGAALFLVVDRSGGSNRPRAAAGAPIAAGCPTAPEPRFGPLGAVAYIHAGVLRVVDLASGYDRALAHVRPAPVDWSPDGRRLTVGSRIVAVANGATCAPFGSTAALTWFPNRDALIVGTAGRFLLAAPGRRPRPLLPAHFSPAGAAPVSSDGRSLVAVGRHAIPARKPDSLWVVDVRTGRRYLLWTPRSWAVGPPTAARWSPDGRWVLFEADGYGSGSIAADGLPLLAVPTGEGPLAHVEPRLLTAPDFLEPCGSSGALVVSAGFDRYVSAGKRIDVVAPPAWRARNLSRDADLSWYAASCSPGGGLVAATATADRDEGRFDSAERSIWLLSRTGARRLLVGTPGDSLSDEQPRWSRDGHWVLYVEHPARAGARARLFLVDVTTGARRGPFANFSGGLGYYGYHDWNELAAWYQPR